ncbi:ABC transporter ATP-binding protein [Clostridium algidicarnis]|uniref:ABC transporter ATP-binding protein n=1 Tax=Clostridium algidicarnis TaxID=37659 RepID=UPI001627D7AF|nr:ABC transporter ATP-binding protein [Clostridium algidicarnis]MBB6698276.1 ABC transporter ATP-binding protein [Clostridium algidicarnis]MBU3197403.1 ABC transporter ATP-binding protein [Clostridium algidicarnis]
MAVIEFNKVNKQFNIYHNMSYSIKEKFINKILRRNKLEVITHQVLKDSTFKVEKGETIGIIGENGTGKSTSLKLISKIIYPDSGEIKVNGKVSALLEIGAGFQPDLTGRENVYLYGSILGLSKEEITLKYDDIVDFSELKEFMDTPVKNYSSGMYMRLAFAVAINVDPDILIIDEVLAVGDEVFQKKCINKILSFKKAGKTIVFVSHDMNLVRKICDRVIFIKKGGFTLEGSPEQMIGLYMKLVYSNDDDKKQVEKEIEKGGDALVKKVDYNLNLHEAEEFSNSNRYGNKKLEITKAYFTNTEGHVRNYFYTGEDININIEFKKNKKADDVVVGFAIYSEELWHLVGHNCKQDGLVITDIQDSNFMKLTMRANQFLKGKYYVTLALHNSDETEQYDFREKHYYFHIIENEMAEFGKVRVNCDWVL